MTRIKDLHADWMKDPAYSEARMKAGLTQEELAERMKTSQSAIARLESGRTIPSARTLVRFAKATGTRLRISFEAAPSSATM